MGIDSAPRCPVTHPFATLSPRTVVAAIESLGIWLPGEPYALNSYENRVYLLHDDDGRRWGAKFYRPERWSGAQIQEEQDFPAELVGADVERERTSMDSSQEA